MNENFKHLCFPPFFSVQKIKYLRSNYHRKAVGIGVEITAEGNYDSLIEHLPGSRLLQPKGRGKVCLQLGAFARTKGTFPVLEEERKLQGKWWRGGEH